VIEGSYQGFDLEVRPDGVGLVTFNRPERLNAMSFGTKRDLSEMLTLAQFDDALRVLVITGSGRGFVAGVDNKRTDDPEPPSISNEPSPHRKAPISTYERLHHFAQEPIRALRRLDKLTIAAVNGYAIQLGLSIVLACDFAVAGRSARLGSATLRMGWQPDEGGHWLLVEHLGVKRALDFMLRKAIVDGEEAHRLGLVTEVVDDDQVLERSLALAAEFASGPQVSIRLLKRAVYNAASLSFDQAGDDIATKTAISDFHTDAKAGSEAFFARRTPKFNEWLNEEGDLWGQRDVFGAASRSSPDEEVPDR
jgi:2-(1,2-epoxy-1,2-dihydrophenyl)acetyl-CoA isomerase